MGHVSGWLRQHTGLQVSGTCSTLESVSQLQGWWCRWAYEQVAEALCRLYKDVNGRVGQHLLYSSARPGCPGALADALLALAQGLSTAKPAMRWSLRALHHHPT